MQPTRRIILTAAIGLISPLATFAASPLIDPATRPTTEPTAIINNDDDMKQIAWPTIATAVKLGMKDRLLTMTTDLPAIEETAQLNITDFAGKTVVVNNPETSILSIRHQFSFLPSTTVSYTLAAFKNNLNVSVDSEDDKVLRSVQFIQNPLNNLAENSEPTVKLFISVSDMNSDKKSVDLRLTADDVVQLRRKYPRETAQYFQPVLAALRQEDVVFSVDHRTAWQVLQSHFKIDELTADQVKRLLKDIDAEEYATRESASEALDKLGEPAALVLLRMGRSGLSSEQNSRMETFLAPYKPLKDDLARQYASDVWFLLDCLATDDHAIRQAAIAQLASVRKRSVDLKPDASPSAWRAGVREIRKELLATPTTRPASAPATSQSN